MECPTDVLRFTDPKVGNALRSLDFMADADNMPAAEAKPVAIVISITIKLVGASRNRTCLQPETRNLMTQPMRKQPNKKPKSQEVDRYPVPFLD